MGGLFSSEEKKPATSAFTRTEPVYHWHHQDGFEEAEERRRRALLAEQLRRRALLAEEQQRQALLAEQLRRRALLNEQRFTSDCWWERHYGSRRSTENEVQSLRNNFGNLTLRKNIFEPIPVKADETLIKKLLPEMDFSNVYSDVYKTDVLSEHDIEYVATKAKFRSTNKNCFSITKIEKITNLYLLAQYKLKKLEYLEMYGCCEENKLFHGTKLMNIKKICQKNFDWRLRGTARGHIFGQGVSFTPISNYATNYGDKTVNKVMILADVLVSNECVGSKSMIIPPEGADTSVKENRHVYVKYEDNTFYPSLIIYYKGFDYKNKTWKEN